MNKSIGAGNCCLELVGLICTVFRNKIIFVVRLSAASIVILILTIALQIPDATMDFDDGINLPTTDLRDLFFFYEN
jgi:hypothetical protein